MAFVKTIYSDSISTIVGGLSGLLEGYCAEKNLAVQPHFLDNIIYYTPTIAGAVSGSVETFIIQRKLAGFLTDGRISISLGHAVASGIGHGVNAVLSQYIGYCIGYQIGRLL